MKLWITWRSPEPVPALASRKPQMLVVDYVYPLTGWLQYRKTGETGVHLIPSDAVREVWTEPQPGDTDPMKTT